ncbi:putative hydrocarbon binding protein [Salirhabdus euzebyi]|uniref:Putative hydrocarbon binding protein n=1 Tax=Salirhabdus euzebyi TaxID=394506 RepID=A0A841PW60_9BACI|nr:DUF2507 domain-containing protein [Salirhabdus euzebyi]MBB6452034.1 putative hydrocarbon binding protein [Salirhabdus euzebyi]
MRKNDSLFTNDYIRQLHIPALGSELIRHISLPELLGEDAGFVQYYIGKNLARQYPLDSIDEIIQFFQEAGFGRLELTKEKNKEFIFSLSSSLISERFQYKENVYYRLEAGFIAEQLSHILQEAVECMDEAIKRKKIIQFQAVPSE